MAQLLNSQDSKHILQCDFTTSKQSERLLELGLPADSANIALHKDGSPHYLNYETFSEFAIRVYSCVEACPYDPCWTFGRLMEIFDICYVGDRIDDEWPKTDKMSSNAGCIINYIVGIYEIAAKENGLDFSKLGGGEV